MTSTAENNLSPASLSGIFDYEETSGLLRWRARGVRSWDTCNAGKLVGTLMLKGYLSCTLHGETFLVHRIIWAIENGKWPDSHIDHINGNRADNRYSNLRDVSPLENRRNSGVSLKNTSGHLGVNYRPEKGKWRAYIGIGNKSKQLGYFNTLEDAIAARKVAESKYGFHANHGVRQCHK